MKIKINGAERRLDHPVSLRELLDTLDIRETRGIAVALNQAVVPRAGLDTTTVVDGDEVEVIRAVQGG